MFKDILKNRSLIIPIAILAVVFIILNIGIVRVEYLKNKSLLEIENKTIIATKISKILHELQRERGLSIGFISDSGLHFKESLYIQREKTDTEIKKIKQFLILKNENKYKYLIDINDLKQKRELVNKKSTSVVDIVEYYSNINSKLLNEIVEISKSSKLQEITQHIVAYSNFLYFKENVGIERAIGTSILSHENLNHKEILQLNTLIVKQNLYLKNFLNYGSKNSISYYEHLCLGKSLDKILKMRRFILSNNKKDIFSINVDSWFKYQSLKINALNAIDNHLSKEILFDIELESNNTKKDLYFMIILNIGSFFIFIFMIGMILNLIRADKQHRSLLDKYIIRSTTNTKGIIISTSEAFCKASGYTREELIGKQHNIVRHPDMPKSVYAEMWETIKSGKIWTGKIKNIKKNGVYYWVNAVIEPIKDRRGNILSYVAIRENITDKIKLDELNHKLEEKIQIEVDKNREKDRQMIQQSRLAQMGEMISMIAHQWRQPLTAISSTTSAIHLKAQLGKLDQDTAIKLSSQILNYTQHLSTTIDDFRDFFKSNKEKSKTTYSELIKSTLGIVEESLSNQNIDLIQKLESNSSFNSYHNELKQVILNLIKNAEDILVENSIENPYIKIHTFEENHKLILEIHDNGGGIPEEIIDKIFDPYFSTKIQKDGTGLGLYMSKTIIEDHCKGTLSVFNNDDGAVFRIELLSEVA